MQKFQPNRVFEGAKNYHMKNNFVRGSSLENKILSAQFKSTHETWWLTFVVCTPNYASKARVIVRKIRYKSQNIGHKISSVNFPTDRTVVILRFKI